MKRGGKEAAGESHQPRETHQNPRTEQRKARAAWQWPLVPTGDAEPPGSGPAPSQPGSSAYMSFREGSKS